METVNATRAETVIALHEAAHATTSIIQTIHHPRYGSTFHLASILPENGLTGYIVWDCNFVSSARRARLLKSASSRLRHAIVCATIKMAPMAFDRAMGSSLGCWDDDAAFPRAYSQDIESLHGVLDFYRVPLSKEDTELNLQFYSLAWERAQIIVKGNVQAIGAIAEHLLEHKTLSYEQCRRIALTSMSEMGLPRGLCPGLPSGKELQPLVVATKAELRSSPACSLLDEQLAFLDSLGLNGLELHRFLHAHKNDPGRAQTLTAAPEPGLAEEEHTPWPR